MKKIKINNVHIQYEIVGHKESPCVVFNNGFLMDAKKAWKQQIEMLSEQYCVLRYNFRGQGGSDHPKESYTVKQHADDLAGLMLALNIKKAHVVGLSYGGSVAQTFAIKYPDLCLSLILTGSVSEVKDRLRFIVSTWFHHATNKNIESFFYSTVPWFFTSNTFSKKSYVIENARERYSNLDFEAVANFCQSFLSFDVTNRLSEIVIPTCIISGQQDLIAEEKYLDTLHQNITTSELHVVPNAGHIVCWERAEEFNAILFDFLVKQAK